MAHLLCEQCEKDGRLTSVAEVHHILTLADGSTHDDENLVALCKSCHSNIPIGSNNIKRQQDDQNYPVGYINRYSFNFVQRGRLSYENSRFQDRE